MSSTQISRSHFDDPGAPAPHGVIPLSVPEIRGNEWKYIKECLDTNWVSSVGSFVDRFERMVADYVGTKYAVATVSGTAALHIALLVASVQPDDEVLVSTLTFIATANVVRYVGAWPVFVDAEPKYWQMDPQKVAEFLENECRWVNGELRNKVSGRRVKAIIPVHILGHPCDMTPILGVARKYDLTVIEDAAESLGAKYKDLMVGHIGDIACLSFNGNKLITTGGGGMVITDNADWASTARYLSTQAKDDPVEYVHNQTGYNYRLTNIQAAMGCAQMEQLDFFIQRKRQIAAIYNAELEEVPGICVMRQATYAYSTYWLFTILIDHPKAQRYSRRLMSRLSEHGIQSRPLWLPLHRQPIYQGCHASSTECADQLYASAVQLPSSVGLTDAELDYVIGSLKTLYLSIYE